MLPTDMTAIFSTVASLLFVFPGLLCTLYQSCFLPHIWLASSSHWRPTPTSMIFKLAMDTGVTYTVSMLLQAHWGGHLQPGWFWAGSDHIDLKRVVSSRSPRCALVSLEGSGGSDRRHSADDVLRWSLHWKHRAHSDPFHHFSGVRFVMFVCFF